MQRDPGRRKSRRRRDGSSDGGNFNPDFNEEVLLQIWGVRRKNLKHDAWNMARRMVKLESHDVAHTGCCKVYALVWLFFYQYPFDSEGKVIPELVPSRLALDFWGRHLRMWIAEALTPEIFNQLRSKFNYSNRAYWTEAIDFEEAKRLVSLTYDAARKLGHAMSPVWLEEWETTVIASQMKVLVLEVHTGAASNCDRSCCQVILPSPYHEPSLKDEVIVLRRIGCHYHPVWVNGNARTPLGNLPEAFRNFFLKKEEL